MNKTTKTVIRIAILVVISALIGLSIYSINIARLNGDAMPMPLGFGATVVLSGSMEPELSTGDLLIVQKTQDCVQNDVVVFQTGRSAVVHRIVSIDGDTVITKGDANNTEDDPITFAHIKGKVILAIPLVGYVVNVIKTPIGTIILLALAVWLLESSFKKDKRKDKAELDAIKAEIEKLKQDRE